MERLTRRRVLTLLGGVGAAGVLEGCNTSITVNIGSNPTPTARSEAPPTTVQPAKPLPVIQVTPTAIRVISPEAKHDNAAFDFGDDVPENQKQEIRDAVNIGTNWYSSHGINIENISVFAYGNAQEAVNTHLRRSPGAGVPQNISLVTAFVGAKDDFYIITTSDGWTKAPPIIGGTVPEGRYYTIVHELFNVWQRKIGAYDHGPVVAWMNAGIAHYLPAIFLKEKNMYSYKEIRNGHLKEAARVSEKLSSLETYAAFHDAGNKQTADEYSLAFIGVEYLVRGLPNSGINAATDYWKRISQRQPHPMAFKAAFGKTPEEFYKEFEIYRMSLKSAA